MGFCSKAEHEEFLVSTPRFEEILIGSGIRLLKYYLDIGRHEQKARLADRARDPLTQWKISPIDHVALKHWDAYSAARDSMLLRTHTVASPWRIVRADIKQATRLNLIRDILSRLDYAGKDEDVVRADANVVFPFSADCIRSPRLAY